MDYEQVQKSLLEFRAPADHISWRAGAVSKDKKRAQALAYAEPRTYMDALDALAPGWQVDFIPWGENKLICRLSILGVVRSSTGEYEENARGAIAQGTVAEAQAFKRACVNHGLMRYLYEVEAPWVDYDDEKRRLVETPELPARFLPPRQSGKIYSTPTKAAPQAEEAEAQAEEEPGKLPPERATAMGRELEKLGFKPKEQLRLASSVLGRQVSALTQLTEPEALEVWTSARRLSKNIA